MSSALLRGNPIFPVTGVDLSNALGCLVTFAAGVPAVSASATVPAVAVVVEANVAAKNSSVYLLGAGLPPTFGKISAGSAALKFGDTVMQAADGTLTKDVGPGTARVVVGVVGDLKGAVAGDVTAISYFTPQVRA